MNLECPHTWPRLYVAQDLRADTAIELPPESGHYLLHVLRAQAGDPVRLFNGRDGEWLGRLHDMPKGKKAACLLHIETKRINQTPCPDLWLCAAPIKKAHFDFLIQKATELGVSVIQPVLTARTQIREVNVERLRLIAIEAAEQSERLDVPEIKKPITLPRLIESWPAGRRPIVCAEFGHAQPVRQAFATPIPSAALWTGPEGGYTQDEMNALHTLPDLCALRLGPRILRADTAACAALACWQALSGDWDKTTIDSRSET